MISSSQLSSYNNSNLITSQSSPKNQNSNKEKIGISNNINVQETSKREANSHKNVLRDEKSLNFNRINVNEESIEIDKNFEAFKEKFKHNLNTYSAD